MRNLFHFTALLLICSFCYTKVTAQSADTPKTPIHFGQMDMVHSEILGEDRNIMVYVPEGGANETYPVVYLLDGDGHYYSVSGMIRQLSSTNGNTVCPKMIVVAIPNTNRTRDLTPTKGMPDGPFEPQGMIAVSGGGERFLDFIEKELIPYVEANYPTQPYRTFIGHSFGGLTVMHAWLHRTDLFNAYIAIDPSMWWARGQLLQEIKATPIDQKFKGISLFVGIANTMEAGMDTLRVQQDTSYMTRHIRSILALNQYLKAGSGPYLKYKGNYYPENDHGSVPLITEYDALRFIFDFYELKMDMPDYMDPERDLAGKLAKHYRQVSDHLGYEVKPQEDFVNMAGYQTMGMKHYKKAEALFKMNVANYPESANVWDSLADYYSAVGDKENAIKNYEKSLSIDESSPSREKLVKLTGK